MDFPTIFGRDIVLDCETTGLKWWTDKIFGIALYVGGQGYYWDVRKHPQVFAWLRKELPLVASWTNHHIKFDMHMLMNEGIRMPPWERVHCTMIQAALIDEHLMSYDLDSVGKKYTGHGKMIGVYDRLSELFGGKPTKDAQMKNLQFAPDTVAGPYAIDDVISAYKLGEWQAQEIVKQDLTRIVMQEHRLMPVVVKMERKGVRVDIPRAEKAMVDIDIIVKQEQKLLNDMAGFEVNPNPSGSISKLFQPKKNEKGQWVLRDGTYADKTDGGKPSLNADCLRRMKDPAAAKILELRKFIRIRDVFLKGHILGSHDNGYIHSNINQTKNDADAGTGTGRLSMSEPALQQIPARDKRAKAIVRPCFLPDEGKKWVGMDWAQMDFRMFAHYTKVPVLLERYAADPTTDFHQATADLVGIVRSATYAGQPNAKQINLGLVFGMGQGKLAQEIGLPYTEEEGRGGKTWLKPGPEAVELFERYHEAVPGIKEFLDQAQGVAKRRGYIMSVMGRHMRFPRGMFVHKAGGYLFQSACAEAMKQKMIEFDEYCDNHDGRLVLSVHDELGLSMPEDANLKEIKELYTRFDGILTPIQFRVPIDADVGMGNNWFEGH